MERIHHEVLLASTPTLVLTEGKNGSWHYLSIKLDKLKGKPVKGDGYDFHHTGSVEWYTHGYHSTLKILKMNHLKNWSLESATSAN